MDASQDTQDEIELIQSMYPGHFRWIESPPCSALAPNSQSFELSLSGQLKDEPAPGLHLCVTIPSDYPTKRLPTIIIKSEHMSREDEARLNKDYKTWMDSNQSDKPPTGEICMDILINKILELASGFSPKTSISTRANEVGQSIDSENPKSNASIPDHLDMAWSVFWMHHIMATSKRKNIVDWARELHIRGWSKPGYPGALIIDGPETSVKEYSNRLKSLRWKAIQQRHFETYQIPFAQDFYSPQLEPHRKIKKIDQFEHTEGVIEVQSMSELLAGARSTGLEHEVLEILKIK